jgi:hypothetical protein
MEVKKEAKTTKDILRNKVFKLTVLVNFILGEDGTWYARKLENRYDNGP